MFKEEGDRAEEALTRSLRQLSRCGMSKGSVHGDESLERSGPASGIGGESRNGL